MKNHKALITGASSGIGLVFAKELAKEGYNVTCVARHEEKLKELVQELGGEHRYIRADLTDPKDLAKIRQDLAETKYQLLINNAGYGIYEKFNKIPLDKINNLIQLNISTLVQLSHEFIKNAAAGDALINVSSVLSLLPYPGGAVYSGTKAFVTNFTEALWYECKDKDIYVMALLPGVTDTNFHRVAIGTRNKSDPSGPSYPPEVVVKEALRCLKKRSCPSIISGPRYRFLAAITTRLLSRKRIIEIMGKDSPGMH
ncbi:MAG: SDR family NAD(P)-dependent oxidoreductase [Proteobacteria bacterium]|nr:SDR family NAD(P)-dependent oxidoreductase [Pseudomonadota bacterium]MBU1714658.1 SDR family NAD(P)-dependent oxidoreductase [Pseudomonadota bacterium]